MEDMKTLDDTLAAITAGACAAIDWADHASVCVTYQSGLDSLGATDPLVQKADAAQDELQEGPTITVAPGTPLVHSDDAASDPRWPRYARVAAELGIRAQTGVLVAVGADHGAVLNLYSRSQHPLNEAAAEVARIFADQAATAIDCAYRVETLTGALDSRQEISLAIGIVMERFGLNETRAFDYLVRVSQTSQVKLRLIAQELVAGANAKGVIA
jgi:GAF domain-containing protein